MAWYFEQRGRRIGPVSSAAIRLLIDRGALGQDDLIWRDAETQPRRIGDVVKMTNTPPPATAVVMEAPACPAPAPAPVDPVITEEPQLNLRPQPRGGFLRRHWEGQYSLARSYWVHGVLGGLALRFALSMVELVLDDSDMAYGLAIWLTTYWAATLLVMVWLWCGTWRAASRHLNETGRTFWPFMAKAMIVVGMLGHSFQFLNDDIGYQGIVGNLRQEDGDETLPPFQLRLLRSGAEVEFIGGFRRGAAQSLQQVLERHKGIKVVHLTSAGGLVNEGLKMHDVIRKARLNTYVSSFCASACTLAFMGGEDRALKDHATLGYHSPDLYGLKGSLLRNARQVQLRFFEERGVDPAFAQKAVLTPNQTMWSPKPDELQTAGVITRTTDGYEYAISGEEDADNPSHVTSQLLQEPMFRAIRKRFPERFDVMAQIVSDAYAHGISRGEMQAQLSPHMQAITDASRPIAADVAIRDYTRVFVEQMWMLSKVDAGLCHAYAYNPQPVHRYATYFPGRLRQAEKEALLAVIESADTARTSRSDQQALQLSGQVWSALRENYGRDVETFLASQRSGFRGNFNPYVSCRLTIAYYQAALSLPASQSAELLRFLYTDASR